MRESKKAEKVELIIAAAEKVFSRLGFKNAKMEDIADACDLTKVTVYSYFQSKENLYMAITHKAMEHLNYRYSELIKANSDANGLDVSLLLIESFMEFCEEYYLYSEALLDYFSLIRAGRSKFTDALKESIYFKKAQDIQNVAFKYVIQQMVRGKKDGSIRPDIDPAMATLVGWTSGLGYAKVISASGGSTDSLLNVNLLELKKIKIELARTNMSNLN